MSTKIKKDPSITKQHRMVIDIIHTAQWLDERITPILKDFGITHPQFNILKNVQAASPEPLSVNEIKDTIMFKNSDVTRLLDRLVKKQMLTRETCLNNRRKVDIRITNKGTKTVNSITPKIIERFNKFCEDQISVEEALATSEILRLIRKNNS